MKKHEDAFKAVVGPERLAAAEHALEVAGGAAEPVTFDALIRRGPGGTTRSIRALPQQALEDAIILLATGFGGRYGHDGHAYRAELHHALVREVRERQEREGFAPPAGFRSRRSRIEARLATTEKVVWRGNACWSSGEATPIYEELDECRKAEKGERLVFAQPDWFDHAVDGEILVIWNRWTGHRPVSIPVEARQGRLLFREGEQRGQPVEHVVVPWDTGRGVRILHAQDGLLAWEGLVGTEVRTKASAEQEEDVRLQQQA